MNNHEIKTARLYSPRKVNSILASMARPNRFEFAEFKAYFYTSYDRLRYASAPYFNRSSSN